MKLLDRIDGYLLNEVTATIKVSRSNKKDVERILDGLGVDYTDAGNELDATFKSRKEAKKAMEKLPPIRYTISEMGMVIGSPISRRKDFDEGKFVSGFWVTLSGKGGELDKAFAPGKKEIKKILINWANSGFADGDTIKIQRGKSEI